MPLKWQRLTTGAHEGRENIRSPNQTTTSSETQGRSVRSGITAPDVFKNGRERASGVLLLTKPVPRLIRMFVGDFLCPTLRAEVSLSHGFQHLRSHSRGLCVAQLVCLRPVSKSHAKEKLLLARYLYPIGGQHLSRRFLDLLTRRSLPANSTVDNVIHFSNNWGQMFKRWVALSTE